jgi:hypothetical protein
MVLKLEGVSLVGRFHEGMAYVETQGDKEGFIDRTGRVVFEGQVVQVGTEFSEGLAPNSVTFRATDYERSKAIIQVRW